MLKKILNAFFVFCTLSVMSLFFFAPSAMAEDQVLDVVAQPGQSAVVDNGGVGDISDGATEVTVDVEIPDNQNETQNTDYSCGPAALVTWIRILGGEATEQELIELAKTNAEEGTSFLNLKNAALAKGYSKAVVYKFILEDIGKITFPALVYLNVEGSEIGHFAVLTKIENSTFYISDPQAGQITKTKEEFLSEFGEYAMVNGDIIFSEPVPNADQSIEGGEDSPLNSADQAHADSTHSSGTDDQTNKTVPATDKGQEVVTVKAVPVVVSDDQLAKIRGKGLKFGWNKGPMIYNNRALSGGRYLHIDWDRKRGWHVNSDIGALRALNHYSLSALYAILSRMPIIILPNMNIFYLNRRVEA